MSDKLITVDVVSQEGSVFKNKARMVSLRGSEGEMGISYGHTQLLSTMPAGVVSITKEDGSLETLFVSGGVVEVQPNQVIILADVMERAQDMSKAAAEEAKAKAEAALKSSETKVDLEEARQMLAEAEARLKTLNSSRGLYYTKDE